MNDILVVEDDLAETILIRRALRMAGFENFTHIASTAHAAILFLDGTGQYADRAKYPLPALIVLDHKMPATEGWEVLRFVRAHPKLSSLPVVIFSGSENPAHKERASEMGANAYYVKPTDFEEYQKTVAQIAQSWLSKTAQEKRPRSP